MSRRKKQRRKARPAGDPSAQTAIVRDELRKAEAGGDEEKSIGSGSLAGGGKLNPARSLPEEPGLARVESIEKIQDVTTYDPGRAPDPILRDDFRTVLAWYSQAKESSDFKHPISDVEGALRAIIKEATRRGPEVIKFDPAGMLPSVRDFFLRVAREARVPARMFKRLDLRPDTDPDRMSTGELLAAHWQLHQLFRRGREGWTTEGLSNLHAAIVDELFERKVKHPAPPDEGLDGNSATFELHAGDQPNWAEAPPARILKAELDGAEFTTKRISKPFSSPGGKDLWARKIVGALPEHKVFVEPYAGSATVFFAKTEPSDVEVLSDVNPEIVNALRFIQSGTDQDFEWMRSQYWKWSKSHFEKLKKTTPSGVRERAYKFKYLNLYSYRGAGDRFNPTATASKETTGGEFLRKLEVWRERLVGVKILEEDALAVMKKYDSPKTVFYVDPPWKDLTGRDEWKNFDAEKLLATLKGLKGRILMSYQGELDLGPGWSRRSLSVTQGGVAGSSSQDLYTNFDAKTLDEWATKADEQAVGEVQLEAAGERSKREDAIALGRFFPMPTPTRFVVKGERQSTEQFLSLFHRAGRLPAIVQKKTEGIPVQVHRLGDRVKIITADRVDITDRVPNIVEAVKGLKVDDVVLVGELEAWQGRQRMPARTVADYLAGRNDNAAEDLVLSVYDVPYHGEDIHKSAAVERFGSNASSGLGISQATMGAPNTRARLNAVVGVKVYTLTDLEKAVRRVRVLPGSVGAIVKQADSEYELGSTTEKWAELHNSTIIQAAIIGREESSDGRVYRCGVLPGSSSPADLVTLGGAEYVPVEGELRSDQDLNLGEKVAVEVDLVSVDVEPGGLTVGILEPRILGQVDELDTVEELTKRARGDFALREIELGELRPVEKAITKQGDPFMEIPPEKAYQYVAHNHFRGKSLQSDIRIELRPGKTLIGWTLKTQVPVDLAEPVTTLSRARAMDWADISRIDWSTGEWASGIPVEKKAAHPYAWIDVEGATKAPEEGEAPPVGGTAEFPGVFRIVDKGSVEYGAQKSDAHEYFFHGGALNYRVILRKAVDAERWIAMKADDPTPYVLKSGWIPPVGISALPGAVRAQVPSSFRYWTEKTSVGARRVRDELVVAIKAGDVKLDFGAPFRRAAKASDSDGRFALQRLVELGSERARWYLRIDSGRDDLTVVEVEGDPSSGRTVAKLARDRHRESMSAEGELRPGHYLNPSKETSSRMELVDKGRATVLVRSSDYLRVKLTGSTFTGVYQVKKGSSGEWVWEPAGRFLTKSLEDPEACLVVPILKVNIEKRLATGVVLEPDEVDAQGDTQGDDVVEAAAHDFLASYNRATELGINHKIFGDLGISLVESWVAPFDLKLGNQDIKAGSWIMTIRADDEQRWAEIKSGEITGFSVGGWASVRRKPNTVS